MAAIHKLATVAVVCALFAGAFAEDLKIKVEHLPTDCTVKAKAGDRVAVHYAGRLEDGKEFDNSFKRGEPIKFTLGEGQVIKGWDQGVEGMCAGEKRHLRIPPHLGYGERGIGPIPGGATLLFDVELVKIN